MPRHQAAVAPGDQIRGLVRLVRKVITSLPGVSVLIFGARQKTANFVNPSRAISSRSDRSGQAPPIQRNHDSGS